MHVIYKFNESRKLEINKNYIKQILTIKKIIK